MVDVVDGVLRVLSDETLFVIGLSLLIETHVEGGNTAFWTYYTASTLVLYVVANYVHEGSEDMIEELHEELDDDASRR